MSAPKPSSHVATGSSRSRIFRACCTMRPAVLMIKKRSRFGRARNNSAGNAIRFSAVSTLCAIAASLNQVVLAPKYLLGITPPASSFFILKSYP